MPNKEQTVLEFPKEPLAEVPSPTPLWVPKVRKWPEENITEAKKMTVQVRFDSQKVVLGAKKYEKGKDPKAYVYLVDGTKKETFKVNEKNFDILDRRQFNVNEPPCKTARKLSSSSLRSYYYLGTYEETPDGRIFVGEETFSFAQTFGVRLDNVGTVKQLQEEEEKNLQEEWTGAPVVDLISEEHIQKTVYEKLAEAQRLLTAAMAILQDDDEG
jgi:hypothetical protein